MATCELKTQRPVRFWRNGWNRFWRGLQRFRCVPWLLITIALAAAWIDLSRFHEAIVADTLIPILSSLYAWEPFFWGQARIGTLAPLLAAPISNPWYNLLFQTWFSVATSLTLLVLLVSYVYQRHGWRQIALVSVAAFLFVAPLSTQYVLLSTQVWGAALSLGLASLLILRSRSGVRYRSIAVALLLSIIAHWLNGLTAVLLVPLVIARGVLEQRAGREPRVKAPPLGSEGVVGSLTLIVGFVVGQILAWASPYPLAHLQVLALGQWPDAWRRMAASTWDEASGPWSVLLLASGAVGLAIGLLQHRRGRPAEALRLALPLCATASAYWLLLGASEWVKMNHYHPRYATPALLCLHTAAVIVTLVPLTQFSRKWGDYPGTVAVSLLLVVAIVWSYGLPSPTRAREAVDERLGGLSEDVRSGEVTHVLGNYGTVWTTVYHSNLLRYEEGRPGVIWGIAPRAGPTAKYWRKVPLEQWRVGVKSGEHRWQEIASRYRLPELTVVDQVGALLILTPRTFVETLDSSP